MQSKDYPASHLHACIERFLAGFVAEHLVRGLDGKGFEEQRASLAKQIRESDKSVHQEYSACLSA